MQAQGTDKMQENNGNSTKCSYFMDRKKRYCKMTVGKGRKYCGEHEHLCNTTDNVEDSRKRIVCPIDSSHTIFEKNLQKHTRRCNKGFVTLSTPENSHNEESEEVRLIEIGDDELMEFIENVETVYADIKIPVETDECRLNLSKFISKHDKKHGAQISSIISHFDNMGLFQSDTCFIELGAGRGELTSEVINATSHLSNCSYLLVDRASQRHKFDTKFRKKEETTVARIKIDIENLDIDKLDRVKEAKNVVVLSKHLCGSATDLSLRCILSSEDISKFRGLSVALCCYHRCRWDAYVGKEFLMKHNMFVHDFELLKRICTWSICGKKPEKKQSDQMSTEENKRNRYVKLGLSHEYRELIGWKAKHILDAGRIDYLKECGHKHFTLKKYVDSDITLENILLIGTF